MGIREQKIFNHRQVNALISLAINEDIGNADITTLAFVPENYKTQASFIAKEKGIICGLALIKKIISLYDADCTVNIFKEDGEMISKGEVFAKIKGKARAILTTERVILNFLQRLSGIATKTKKYTEKVKNTKIQILDTRKTTPGWRILEKYAVSIGEGMNHRAGLFDQFLIKENHWSIVKKLKLPIEKIINECRLKNPTKKIELEVNSIKQLKEAMQLDIDTILLDNMNKKTLDKAIKLIQSKKEIEISGNIDKKKLQSLKKLQVNFISIGSLTHSFKSIDLSLLIDD